MSRVASESLSLSSERFTFNEEPEEEEDTAVESIRNSRDLFVEFRKKPPTFKEALVAMECGEEKAKELSEMFLERARRKLEEFDAPGIIAEDVAVFFCYTYE